MHECKDCGVQFNVGENDAGIQPTVQCPGCNSYHTQPYRAQPSPTQSDMTLRNVPGAGADDDTGGNPLREGFMGDYQNSQVRDESWGGGITGRRISLFETPEFETPEFETTQIIAPQDLYRHALETEAAHKANIQLPKGITDNLHAALGNLGAWVENPYENSQLRPYNEYWKSVRPSFMKPGSIQIGVADPTMAEIINHVAQTNDVTPLYEYRGKQASVKTAGPALALLPEGAAALAGGGADLAGAAAATDAAAGAGAGALADVGGPAAMGGLTGDAGAAASAGSSEAASSAGGIGGLMKRVMSPVQGVLNNPAVQGVRGVGQLGQGLSMLDDVLGMGGGGAQGAGGVPIHDTSFYAHTASDENDLYPSHDEIPKQEDGDYHQQDDGNHHEWQRDNSVDEDGGGALHAPSFNQAGPAFQRFMMLFPLIQQLLDGGQDGSEDPLIKGLHDSLEAEIPGYQGHGDDNAADQLILLLSPQGKASEAPESASKAKPEENEPDSTDENSGGAHESKVASLNGEVAEFLPDLTVTLPALKGARRAAWDPVMGPASPQEELLNSDRWPKPENEACPYCGHFGPVTLGMCAGCGQEIYDHPNNQDTAMEHMATTQGPTTPEQIQVVQQFLIDNAEELGLHGQELTDTVLSVPTNPLQFADVLAQIQGKDSPPVPEDDAGFSGEPPPPAQEAAPPGATMPVPGMSAQMMSAVKRYAADSVAGKCPNCGGHTTELLDGEDGTSRCHGCQEIFTTEKVAPRAVNNGTVSSTSSSNLYSPIVTWNGSNTYSVTTNTASTGSTGATWNVDEDLRKEAEAGLGTADQAASGFDPEPVHGVPIADQQHQEDRREEQDSGHTWLDQDGNPLTVGQEYEMYTSKFDIPDLVRIEEVKPDAIVVTFTGEFGMEHSSEITKEEANVEKYNFVSTASEGELGPEDDGSLEHNDDDDSRFTEPGMRDMSAPAGMVAASVRASGVSKQGNPGLSWLMEGLPKTAGANYTPYEQRGLIDEMGTARNADALDLRGTHYIDDADDEQFLFGI